MDEDTAIINSNTRNEKIKNFFVKIKIINFNFIDYYFFVNGLFCMFAEYKEIKK